MTYYIVSNPQSKHGYDLQYVNDKGIVVKTVELRRKTTDNFLWLPEDCVAETNRKCISMAMIAKSGETHFEVEPKEYREPRQLGSNNGGKKLFDYLSDDDKILYLELVDRARKAREAANRPLTPVEKAKRAMERAQATYEKLLREAEENK